MVELAAKIIKKRFGFGKDGHNQPTYARRDCSGDSNIN